jgi:O-Antigen ligase
MPTLLRSPEPRKTEPGLLGDRELLWLGSIAVAHVVLALVMLFVPVVATLHAYVCFLAGIVIAATTKHPRNIAIAVAYIAGSEVWWRMTRASVVWEFGKYAVSAILVIAILRRRSVRNRASAVIYFALLLPSVLLTVSALDFDRARQVISFNLSGPLSLALCIVFFSNARLEMHDLRRALAALIAPIIAIATLTLFKTATTENLEFTGVSSSTTSGGFGPNQVSAILGLGLLVMLLIVLERKQPLRQRIPLIVLAVVFAVQSALTFSRGGLALAFSAVMVALMQLIRNRQARINLFVIGILLFGAARYVVVPRLETFTQGKLSERYTDTNSSNRVMIAETDLRIFVENPVLGVGPGMAGEIRQELGLLAVAHTEYTRMLAEHGMLGALALVVLSVIVVRTLRLVRTIHSRAFVTSLLAWAALFLTIDAMRIVAPAFVVGLACAIAAASSRARAP